jgi:hypothetical protein
VSTGADGHAQVVVFPTDYIWQGTSKCTPESWSASVAVAAVVVLMWQYCTACASARAACAADRLWFNSQQNILHVVVKQKYRIPTYAKSLVPWQQQQTGWQV